MPDDARHDELNRLRHDLRSPLTVVIGFAEILAAERALSDEQRRDYAERVLKAALQLRELLDTAKLD